MPEPDDAAHYVWAIPVLNGGRAAGAYRQVQVRCRCGYREVVIAQVAGMYGQHHYERCGVQPQPVPFGHNGTED